MIMLESSTYSKTVGKRVSTTFEVIKLNQLLRTGGLPHSP